MQNQFLDEIQWRDLTASRLRRAGVTRDVWNEQAARVIETDTFRDYLLFVKNMNIPIIKAFPMIQGIANDYPLRVFFTFYMGHLAILAKDELQYRQLVADFVENWVKSRN